MTDWKARQSRLVKAAAEIADGLRQQHSQVTSACIVSSLAFGDWTPVSDVDMLVLHEGADRLVPNTVYRRVVEDTVVEWVVIPFGEIADVQAVLAHAGLVHDLRTCLILFDADQKLVKIRDEIASRYRDPVYVVRRGEGQLDRLHRSISAMNESLNGGDTLVAIRQHVEAIRRLLALPRALANQRCTMARGFAFCRESARELGWTGYAEDVISLMGASAIKPTEVTKLFEASLQVVAETCLAEEEKTARRHHLRACPWLVSQGPPCDAVWPLYFWTSKTVAEELSVRNGTSTLMDAWHRFRGLLGVSDTPSLLRKLAEAREISARAASLLQAFRALD
jgi:hypothetical protein